MANNLKPKLLSGMKWLSVLFAAALLYILLDFTFNMPSAPVHQLTVPELAPNRPVLLRNDNILVVVARFDKALIDSMEGGGRLAAISSGFRQQQKRADKNGYFVVLGYGSKMGCPLEIDKGFYRESCSQARYDLLGRSSNPQDYPDLDIPQYTFNHDHSLLTIE